MANSSSDELKLVFVIERDTKTKTRFTEVDPTTGKGTTPQPTPRDKAAVEKLYVSKRVLKNLGDPQVLHVTIQAA